jgi:pimeloyl-ACP methyl ester carboxylesterase
MNKKSISLKSFFLKINLGLAAIFAVASCAQSAKVEAPPTAVVESKINLVLISGFHLDERSWDEMIKSIDMTKFTVQAMPRLGRDPDHPAHLSEIAKMSCEKIKGPSVIVGHSFGGAFTNEIMGVCPGKVLKIIYVSALVPLKGEHAMDQLKGVDQRRYGSAVKMDKDRMTPKSQKAILSALDNGVSKEQTKQTQVYPESFVPSGDAVDYNSEAFAKLSKYYIYTGKDEVIPVKFQKKFTDRIEITDSKTIQSGHLPMLTQPKELAKAIEDFAERK